MKPWIRVLLVSGLLLLVAVVVQAQPAQVDEFVPLSPEQLLAEQEQIPAAGLVFAAYGTVWLVFAFYLFTLWRRVSQVESELRTVSSTLEKKGR
jgi:CcmD family protein